MRSLRRRYSGSVSPVKWALGFPASKVLELISQQSDSDRMRFVSWWNKPDKSANVCTQTIERIILSGGCSFTQENTFTLLSFSSRHVLSQRISLKNVEMLHRCPFYSLVLTYSNWVFLFSQGKISEPNVFFYSHQPLSQFIFKVYMKQCFNA